MWRNIIIYLSISSGYKKLKVIDSGDIFKGALSHLSCIPGILWSRQHRGIVVLVRSGLSSGMSPWCDPVDLRTSWWPRAKELRRDWRLIDRWLTCCVTVVSSVARTMRLMKWVNQQQHGDSGGHLHRMHKKCGAWQGLYFVFIPWNVSVALSQHNNWRCWRA